MLKKQKKVYCSWINWYSTI